MDPARALTKGGAKVGDALVLTKPLGFGVTTTALKEEKAAPEDVAEVVTWMKQLNRRAAELSVEFGLRGGTDVTGFGLLGHGMEMAQASRVGLRIAKKEVPFVAGARKYAEAWTFPGGSLDNGAYFGPHVRFEGNVSEAEQMLLFDAQTSGGLLLAVPGEKLKAFLARAEELEQPAWVIGEVIEGAGITVVS